MYCQYCDGPIIEKDTVAIRLENGKVKSWHIGCTQKDPDIRDKAVNVNIGKKLP